MDNRGFYDLLVRALELIEGDRDTEDCRENVYQSVEVYGTTADEVKAGYTDGADYKKILLTVYYDLLRHYGRLFDPEGKGDYRYERTFGYIETALYDAGLFGEYRATEELGWKEHEELREKYGLKTWFRPEWL